MKKWMGVISLGVLIVFMLASCATEEQGTTTVDFMLDWTPNTNHTGIYVAIDQGYYEEEGIEVKVNQPQEGTAEQYVASGRANFGISFQENVTLARAEELPLVSIAAVLQHNTSGFASFKEKGIESIKDLEGKKYGGWGSDIEVATLRYLMEGVGADVNQVNIVTTGDLDFFTASEAGDIDFAWIYEGWQGVEARLRGIELNYIDLGEVSPVFDYYTPVIITSEQMIEDNRDLVERFMKATAKGYAYAIENPAEAGEILLKHAEELDEALVTESQSFLSKAYQADAGYWGQQKTEVWEQYNQWLAEEGFIEAPIDVEGAFTNEFLENE